MPIPDRQKQRREYLRKKGVLSVMGTSGYVAALCLSILAKTGAGVVLVMLFMSYNAKYNLLCTLLSVVCGTVSWALFRFVNLLYNKEAALTYVPPVKHAPPVTHDILHDKESLVRASLEPELVRSAQEPKQA